MFRKSEDFVYLLKEFLQAVTDGVYILQTRSRKTGVTGAKNSGKVLLLLPDDAG
jgi:hypothetical protein